jgi:hypothetical protein
MTRALAIIALVSSLFIQADPYVEQILESKPIPDNYYLDNYYVESKDWTARQKRYAASYILANIVDTHQTVQITNCQALPQCGVIEMNPILGNRPSEEHIYMLKGTLVPLLFYMMNGLESSTRTKTLKWINRFQWSVVVWNDYHLRDQYGVELKYKF